MILPKRKQIRLKDYDYSQNGAYFITICSDKRKRLFWNVGATCGRQSIALSECGSIVENEIKNIESVYDSVTVDKYVIMPDHIHMIIFINNNGRPQVAPTIPRIIQQFKGKVSKQIGMPIWQKSYNDHIIRNEQDLYETRKYIEENYLKEMIKTEL